MLLTHNTYFLSLSQKALAFRLPQHRTFFDIDADCVGIAGNIPWKPNRQWADVLTESGTSLFISVKPGILTEEDLREIREILKKTSTQTCHKIPMDWMETNCPQIWTDEKEQAEYNWYEDNGYSFLKLLVGGMFIAVCQIVTDGIGKSTVSWRTSWLSFLWSVWVLSLVWSEISGNRAASSIEFFTGSSLMNNDLLP